MAIYKTIMFTMKKFKKNKKNNTEKYSPTPLLSKHITNRRSNAP